LLITRLRAISRSRLGTDYQLLINSAIFFNAVNPCGQRSRHHPLQDHHGVSIAEEAETPGHSLLIGPQNELPAGKRGSKH
jgi:hypothetical protein